MDRKQKLIISITGITIVMLALLGLTYGYYLTRIQGNTNTNSISITTAELKLTYGDGMGELVATGVMPGDEVTSKTFTVKNEGQDLDAYTVALINIMNDFTFKDDLEVTVSCESNINSGVCDGFAEDYEDNIYKETYPAVNTELFSLGIKENEIHTFTLKVNYLYQDFDQSDDMGKTLKGKVQIYDPKDTIEVSGIVTGFSEGDYAEIHSDVQTSEIIDGTYKFIGIPADNHEVFIKNRENGSEKSTTLEIKKGQSESITNGVITFIDSSTSADVEINAVNSELDAIVNDVNDGNKLLKNEIINNAKKNINGRTSYSATPKTKLSINVSSVETEMTLSSIEDNYGTSYYFRGNVTDNYLTFNNMCWRVLRILGDGSIKIILADKNNDCSYYSNENEDSGMIGATFYGHNTHSGYSCITSNCENDTNVYHEYDYINSTNGMRYFLEDWYNEKFVNNDIKSKIKLDTWYTEDSSILYSYDYNSILDAVPDITTTYSYATAKRLEKDDLVLINYPSTYSKISSYIGTVSVDEVILAGNSEDAYLSDNAYDWFTLNLHSKQNCMSGCASGDTPYSDFPYVVWDGKVEVNNGAFIAETKYFQARPVITLLSTVRCTGDGTIENPYVIN